MYITRKGKQYAFELDQVTKVAFKQKKLLFPLILGGVIGSLFLIAGFNFLINIWLALIVGLAGLLLFYYGWTGSLTIAVHTKVKEYDIFINEATTPLKAFVTMLNEYFVLGKNKNIQYYLSVTKEVWDEASKRGYISPPSNGLRLHTDKSMTGQDMIFTIDPVQIPNAINYHLDPSSGEVIPFIFGQIDIAYCKLA